MMFSILLIIIASASIQGHMDESEYGCAFSRLVKFLRPYCINKFPITDEDWDIVKEGNFGEHNEKLKKYYECCMTESGLVDGSFEVNEILLKTFMPKVLKEGKGGELIPKCAAKAKAMSDSIPSEDRFWAMKQCIYHGDPENVIIL